MKALRKSIPVVLVILTAVSPLVAAKSADAARAAPSSLALCVDPSGANGCETTIQSAVDLATNGAVITVAAGTYYENVSISVTGNNPFYGGKATQHLNLTINGVGAGTTIVDGGGIDSVFNIGRGTTVTMSGMTIQNGDTKSGIGGGVSAYKAKVSVTECVITGNQATEGGGIYVFGGSLNVTDSTISGNSATLGGGVYISRPGGGQAYITPYTLGYSYELSESRYAALSYNDYNDLSYPPAGDIGNGNESMMLISGSTISNNFATPSSNGFGGSGGGIYLDRGSLTILDSTISGNTAVDGTASTSTGGGIFRSAGRITLNNVTISGNSATTAGGISSQLFSRNGAAGDVRGIFKFIKVANSIIANNTATTGSDCDGVLYSRGYNLILDTTECAIGGDTSTDIIGEDPLLQPLANNGGATETQSLGTGSPALKAGNPATPNGRGNHCLATDQIGNLRLKGECDIGAVQVSRLL